MKKKASGFSSYFQITVSYDGTDFCGWQVQPNGLSVQEVLVKTFKKTFKKKVSILAASRTDAGVHAKGQVAKVSTDLKISCKTLKQVWNNSLPLSISILKIKKSTKEFDLHKSVKEKKYSYTLFLSRPKPSESRFGWFYKMIEKVDWKVFREVINLFQGKNDFKFFSKIDEDEKKETIRKINKVSVIFLRSKNACKISLYSRGFLRFQVRRIIGAAIEASIRKSFCSKDIKRALAGKNMKNKIPSFCAKPEGLSLESIKYLNL